MGFWGEGFLFFGERVFGERIFGERVFGGRRRVLGVLEREFYGVG